MSLVKAATVQIGKSSTASQNFHWRNLLDGLLRLSRGNAEDALPVDVMRVNADNSVSFPSNVSSGVFGVGMTRYDLTSQRAANTTYTNTTGLPIEVMVSFTVVSGGIITYLINGVEWAKNAPTDIGDSVPVTFIVQHNETYRINTVSTLYRWSELRK